MAKTRLDYVLARMCDNGQSQEEANAEFRRLYVSHGRKPGTALQARWPWMTPNDRWLVREYLGLPRALELTARFPRPKAPEPEVLPGDFVTRAEFVALKAEVTGLRGDIATLRGGIDAILRGDRNIALHFGDEQ